MCCTALPTGACYQGTLVTGHITRHYPGTDATHPVVHVPRMQGEVWFACQAKARCCLPAQGLLYSENRQFPPPALPGGSASAGCSEGQSDQPVSPWPVPSMPGREPAARGWCDANASLSSAQQSCWQCEPVTARFLSVRMARRISFPMARKSRRSGCADAGKSTGSSWLRSVWSGCKFLLLVLVAPCSR